MNFIVERITSIDEAVFDECFSACKTEVISNMPWEAVAGINAGTIDDSTARDWTLNHLQTYAATNSDTDGFVFQLKNADTGRVLALHSAKKNLKIEGALALLVVLFNTDSDGRRSVWLGEYFRSTALKDFITSLGCIGWHQDLFTQTLIDAVGDYFANDGNMSDGRTRSRIYSSYGWD